MTRAVRPRKWRAPRLRYGASAQEGARAILAAALAQARSNAVPSIGQRDAGRLHQLRVGLRRYRSALRLFRKLLRKGPRRRLAHRARVAMRPLGEARDWDVLISWLGRIDAPSTLVALARRRRLAVYEALGPVDLAGLAPKDAAWKGKAQPLEAFAARALPRLRRQVMESAHGLDWSDAAQRHRLRIGVKRLRYATDFLGGRTRSLEDLQETLGLLNDLAVARRLLGGLPAAPGVLRRITADERRLVAEGRREFASLEAEY